MTHLPMPVRSRQDTRTVYRSDEKKEVPTMRMMDATATERFNELLSTWRKQGRKLGWDELTEAACIAQEEQAARETETEPGGPGQRGDGSRAGGNRAGHPPFRDHQHGDEDETR